HIYAINLAFIFIGDRSYYILVWFATISYPPNDHIINGDPCCIFHRFFHFFSACCPFIIGRDMIPCLHSADRLPILINHHLIYIWIFTLTIDDFVFFLVLFTFLILCHIFSFFIFSCVCIFISRF